MEAHLEDPSREVALTFDGATVKTRPVKWTRNCETGQRAGPWERPNGTSQAARISRFQRKRLHAGKTCKPEVWLYLPFRAIWSGSLVELGFKYQSKRDML